MSFATSVGCFVAASATLLRKKEHFLDNKDNRKKEKFVQFVIPSFTSVKTIYQQEQSNFFTRKK